MKAPRVGAIAGIAFFWFIGVLCDRMGAYEDRFFATVFLGSGLLFLAMLFAGSAVAGGIIMGYGAAPSKLMESGIYTFGRTPRSLDPQIFHNGMKVILAGEVDGVEEKELGPEEDPRPMVRVIEIHAWTEKRRSLGRFPISQGWEFNQFASPVQGMAR